MKKLNILFIYTLFFILGTFSMSAQTVLCSDVQIKVGTETDPAIIDEFGCNFTPSLDKEDCFLLSFPVFFDYEGSATTEPTHFNVSSLTIQGQVIGGANIVIDADNTGRCEDQNLTATANPTNNTFQVISDAGAEISFATSSTPSFWVFVEVRPGEAVEVDITSVTMELAGQGTCTLNELPAGSGGQVIDSYVAVKSSTGSCQNTNMDLGFSSSSGGSLQQTVSLFFAHDHISNLEVGRFDGHIKITDVHGNLEINQPEGKPFYPITDIEFSPLIVNGNEYTCYFNSTAPLSILENIDNLFGDITINRSAILNEGGEAIIELEWSRWKTEDSGVDECCQPNIEMAQTVSFPGALPCNDSPDVTFSVTPAANQPTNSGCTGEIHYIVTVDKVIGSTFQFIDLEIEFETSGDIILDEAATIEDFNTSNNIGCPDNSVCIGDNCLETSSNSVRYGLCTFPEYDFEFDENSFRVIFSGTNGCVESASFRRAHINGTDANGVSFNCIPEWSNNNEMMCIDLSGNTAGNYPVTGTILTEDNDAVQSVGVEIISDNCDFIVYTSDTECDGFFTDGNQCDDSQVAIVPSQEENPLCGVSTFDLVKISKHILNIELLDSPYKIIAADVNRSGTVSTLDLVQLRKLILHIDTQFSNNTSWRFVDANYSFPNPQNPFQSDFPEEIENFDLDCSPDVTADFIGIKIGDVNLNCNCTENSPDGILGEPIVLTIDKETLGGEARFKFKVEGFTDIVGYQMDLEYDKNVLSFDRTMAQDLAGVYENYFGINTIDNGKIRALWYDENGQSQSLANLEKIFNIVFNGTGDLSSANISLYTNGNSRLTRPTYNNVAYDSEGRMHPIIQKFGDTKQEITDISTFPNPFKDAFQFDIEASIGGFAAINIYDGSGKLLLSKKKYLYEGDNLVNISETSGWSQGLYFYEIETNHKKYSGKVTKQ